MKEIEPIQKLLANDIDPTATQLMKQNFDSNGIDPAMYESKGGVVDQAGSHD